MKVVDATDGREIGYVVHSLSGGLSRSRADGLIVRPQVSLSWRPRQYRRVKLLVRRSRRPRML